MLYIFLITQIYFMIIHYMIKKNSFQQLSIFLEQNLFFSQTKNFISILYSLFLNEKWISHSLYIKEPKCPSFNCSRFYQVGILENINLLKLQRKNISDLDKNFKYFLSQKYSVNLDIYQFNDTEANNFNYDNFLIFFINFEYYLSKNYIHFINVSSCIEIPKETGIDEIILNNFIE